MVERSHVEKQLYDAIKHTIRPSEDDLEAIVTGEQVPLSRRQPRPVDITFPDESLGDAL